VQAKIDECKTIMAAQKLRSRISSRRSSGEAAEKQPEKQPRSLEKRPTAPTSGARRSMIRRAVRKATAVVKDPIGDSPWSQASSASARGTYSGRAHQGRRLEEELLGLRDLDAKATAMAGSA
jgi:hypothetical protein